MSVGMEYKDVAKRLKRIEKTDRAGKVKNRELKNNLVDSLTNQLRMKEGDGAVREIYRESLWARGSGERVFKGFGKGKRGKVSGFEEVSPGRYIKTYW